MFKMVYKIKIKVQMKYIYILIIIGFSCTVFSQNNASDKSNKSKNNLVTIYYDGIFKKAEKQYRQFAYTTAAKTYDELRNANFKKTQVTKRLVDCYRFTNKWEKAEPLYAELTQSDSIDPVYYYYYAQSLRSNGKYAESLIWMDKFNAKNTNDSRGKKFADEKNFIEAIRSKGKAFEISLFEEINSEQADFGAFLMNDELIFASSRTSNSTTKERYAWDDKPFLDIYSAKFKDDKLSEITILPKLVNTKFHEGPAILTKDITTMYFTRNNVIKRKKTNSSQGVNQLLIFKTQKKGDKWSDPVRLPFNNNEYSVGHPALSPDEKRLYFSSNTPGGFGGTDLYYVEIKGDTSYGKPVNLGKEINTEGNEMFPFITESGYLTFASDGQVGFGGLDLFSSTPLDGGMYEKPQNLGEPLNSPNDDFAFYIDKEEKTGFFSSNRTGGKGDDDIYKVKLLKPLKRQVVVTLIALNKIDSSKMQNAVLKIYNNEGVLIKELKTDVNGETKIVVEAEKEYKFTAERDSFSPGESVFNTINLKKDEVKSTAFLLSNMGFNLCGTIKEKGSGTPLKDVKIMITEKQTRKEILSVITSETGQFKKKIEDANINDMLNYIIKLEKDGFLGKTATYSAVLTKPGDYSLNDVLANIEMEKVEVGKDLAKMIDIKPIYFDIAKFNIRKDAALELDKIVQVMKENPNMIIELGSHTDCRSSAASNMTLSDKRAKASAAYIVSKGIDKGRISGKGYGEAKLLTPCPCEGAKKSDCSEEDHQKNRRTEFIIVKM